MQPQEWEGPNTMTTVLVPSPKEQQGGVWMMPGGVWEDGHARAGVEGDTGRDWHWHWA